LSKLPRIRINPNPAIHLEPVDDENFCVIVDEFLVDPESVVAYSHAHADKFSVPERSYPGVLLDVHNDAMIDVVRFIRSAMSKQFSFLKGGIKTSTYLSMATMQPDQLSNLQRLCHTDPRPQPDRRNFAALVYLFRDEEMGGTGFFQWKERKLVEEATALDLEDPAKALAFLQRYFPTYHRPPCYMTQSNEIAELLCDIPARFNRLIFYSGELPHSASIRAPGKLSTDVSRGRLTLNCFVSVLAG
jgi:hypothetical protein